VETRLQADAADVGRQVRELVDLRVDVIVTPATSVAQVAREASTTIPIVNAGIVGGDLIEAGLVASLARPGRNVTGLTTFDSDLVGKRLQLLAEVAPGAWRLAVLWAGSLPTRHELYTQAAELLGAELQLLELYSGDELERVFEAMIREGARALEVRAGPLVNQNRARIVDLAVQHRLPTIGDARPFPASGGLMAYYPRSADLWRRAASYVDRILKGANPAELPVERPTTFDFVINAKTAQALGLTIPHHVLLQATEVIQ
jgi:putative ABC transport system substrate-binding protein